MANTVAPSPDGEADIEYEEYQEFNEYLDTAYGSIQIAGIDFAASRILFEMDPLAYQGAASDFEQERDDQLLELVFSDFPAPIACCLHRAERGFENHMQRLLFLRDTWEALVCFLFATVVGECRSRQLPLKEAKIAMNDIYSDKLFDKLGIIESFLDIADRNGHHLESHTLITADLLDQVRELNRVRNGFSHEAAKSEEQARQLYAQYYPDVLSVLRALELLREVLPMRFVSGAGGLTVRCETFRGSKMVKQIDDIELLQTQWSAIHHLLNHRAILILHNGVIYSVSPFLHFRDHAGQRTDLCFYKKKQNDPDPNNSATGPHYRYEIVGLSESIYLPRGDFQAEMDEIRDLLQKDP